LAGLQQRIEGLAIDWLAIRPGSPFAERTIADTQARSRTGVSVVAVLRDVGAIPAPAPDVRLQPGATPVVVGAAQGVNALAGLADLALNFTPGLVAGLLLGWSPLTAVVLGGVTYVTSSGIVAKVLGELGRLGNRETPVVLSIMVVEDLAMAAYLPLVSGLLAS